MDVDAFLATATTRLALNVMQSAHSRRETAVDTWLNEPVDASADPRSHAERDQAVSCAMLSLLESLTHVERAAFILREAFDYPYREIADLLRLEEANARQLANRARSHVAQRRTRAAATASEQRSLHDAFIAAARHGDVAGLKAT